MLRLFRNLSLFDGVNDTLLGDAGVLVDGNTIRSVGKADFLSASLVHQPHEEVDLAGATVLPGLMNLHEHLTWRRSDEPFEERAIRRSPYRLIVRAAGHALMSLAEGVTTIRDCASRDGTILSLRAAIDAGEARGPRIQSVGAAIAMTGGHGNGAVRNADGPDEVRIAAREQLHRGADWIKLMASGGYMLTGIDQPESQQYSPAELRAGIDEAHRAGKRATVHVHPPAAIRTAIEAGVDCLEHAGLADRDAVELMANHGVFVAPTLCSPRFDVESADRDGRSDWLIEVSRAHLDDQARTFGWMREGGCRIVAGTDAAGDIQHELRYMVELGMSPFEAIQTATKVAAECLGESERMGTIEPGKLADFVAVVGDPLTDIDALSRVYLTVKDGEPYWPSVLRSVLGPGIHSELPLLSPSPLA